MVVVVMHFIPVAPNEERARPRKKVVERMKVWTSTYRPTLVTLPQHGLSHPPAQTTYYFTTNNGGSGDGGTGGDAFHSSRT